MAITARRAPAWCATRAAVATTDPCPGVDVVWSEGLVAGLQGAVAPGSACRLACGGAYETWTWVFDLEPTRYEGAVRCRVSPDVEVVVVVSSEVESRGAHVTWHEPVPGWHHDPGTFLLSVDMRTGEVSSRDRSLGGSCRARLELPDVE